MKAGEAEMSGCVNGGKQRIVRSDWFGVRSNNQTSFTRRGVKRLNRSNSLNSWKDGAIPLIVGQAQAPEK